MKLIRLECCNIRNISQLSLDVCPGLNGIHGTNGSGKTSLLEGIYFLSCGRSFRSSRIASLVQMGQNTLRVTARILHPLRGEIPIGIERKSKGMRIRVQGQSIENLSELARIFPVQVITPWSHRVVEEGPKLRRRFLDWGVFHVEPRFHEAWKRYQRALKQRNALLRKKAVRGDFFVWEKEMEEMAVRIDDNRQTYIKGLIREFGQCIEKILPGFDIQVQYIRGWAENRSLIEMLNASFDIDRKIGHTKHGPQRADLQFINKGIPVQEHFSRGQQKAMILALYLAQAELMAEHLKLHPILLFDDLGSELDDQSLQRVIGLLSERPGQTFITMIKPEAIGSCSKQVKAWFELKEGKLLSSVKA